MKRLKMLALGLALFAPAALSGCGDTSTEKVESKGPGGSTEIKKETTVKGDGGPAAGGETAPK